MFRNILSHARSLAVLAVAPAALLGLALAASAGPHPPGTIGPELGDARIAYYSTGGLATIDQTLLVFDDGSVKFEWRRVPDGASYTLHRHVPVAEVAALKRLFVVGDFESMPNRFVAENAVMDGVRMLVKARFADKTEKSVWTETLAVEDPAFTAIRRTLEGMIADVKNSELLRVRTYLKPFDGRERIFTLLADGRYRIEFRSDGIPIRWMEGLLRPADRAAFVALANTFDFAGARLCEGEHVDGVQHDFFQSGETGAFAVHFSKADDDVRFECLTMIGERIRDIVKAERLGH